MKSHIEGLKRYSALLFKKWILLLFLGLDIIGLLLAFWDIFVPPPILYLILMALGFYWAGYQVFQDMEQKYLASPFNSIKTAFEKVRIEMPELINEMIVDLTQPGKGFVREFFIAKKNWVMNTSGKEGFVYYIEDHEHLEAKIQVLENLGFIYLTKSGIAKWYRMTEEFAELLLEKSKLRYQ